MLNGEFLVVEPGGAEILQEGAVDETEVVCAVMTQDEVSGGELFDQGVGFGVPVVDSETFEIAAEDFEEPLAADEVTGEAGRFLLHRSGEFSEEFFLLLTGEDVRGEGFAGVPVVEEDTARLLVEFDTVAGEFLVGVENRHHREEERIAGEVADGTGFAEGSGNAFVKAGTLGGGLFGGFVPLSEELVDTRVVEVFECGVGETGVGETLRVVAEFARGDDDGDARVSGGEGGRFFDDRGAGGEMEDFVEAVEVEGRGGVVETLFESDEVEAVGGAMRVAEFEKAVAMGGVFAEVDPDGERGAVFIDPTHGEVFQERRFTCSGVAEDDGVRAVFEEIEDGVSGGRLEAAAEFFEFGGFGILQVVAFVAEAAEEVGGDVRNGGGFAGLLGDEDAPERDTAFVGFGADGSELDMAALGLEIAPVAGEIEARGAAMRASRRTGSSLRWRRMARSKLPATRDQLKSSGSKGRFMPSQMRRNGAGSMLRLSGCMLAAISCRSSRGARTGAAWCLGVRW